MGEENDPLTAIGKSQATALGIRWKDVHVDGLHSSPLKRAYDTAIKISEQNESCPKIVTSGLFIERRTGEDVNDLVKRGMFDEAGDLFIGVPRYMSGATPRDYRPPNGGESPNDVVNRARKGLKFLLHTYGKKSEEPPREFVDKVTNEDINAIPEGIPHLVVVTHNIFLCELYEAMLGWNSSYRMTTCNYSNTDW